MDAVRYCVLLGVLGCAAHHYQPVEPKPVGGITVRELSVSHPLFGESADELHIEVAAEVPVASARLSNGAPAQVSRHPRMLFGEAPTTLRFSGPELASATVYSGRPLSLELELADGRKLALPIVDAISDWRDQPSWLFGIASGPSCGRARGGRRGSGRRRPRT